MIYIAVLCNSRITASQNHSTIPPLFIGPYAAANNTALLAWRLSQGTKLYCLVNRGTLGANNLPRVVVRIMPQSQSSHSGDPMGSHHCCYHRWPVWPTLPQKWGLGVPNAPLGPALPRVLPPGEYDRRYRQGSFGLRRMSLWTKRLPFAKLLWFLFWDLDVCAVVRLMLMISKWHWYCVIQVLWWRPSDWSSAAALWITLWDSSRRHHSWCPSQSHWYILIIFVIIAFTLGFVLSCDSISLKQWTNSRLTCLFMFMVQYSGKITQKVLWPRACTDLCKCSSGYHLPMSSFSWCQYCSSGRPVTKHPSSVKFTKKSSLAKVLEFCLSFWAVNGLSVCWLFIRLKS